MTDDTAPTSPRVGVDRPMTKCNHPDCAAETFARFCPTHTPDPEPFGPTPTLGGGLPDNIDIKPPEQTSQIRERTQPDTPDDDTPSGPVVACLDCETHYGPAPDAWAHCPACGGSLTTLADGRAER